MFPLGTHCCRMAPVFGSFERSFAQTVRSYPFSMCLKNRWMVRGVTDSKADVAGSERIEEESEVIGVIGDGLTGAVGADHLQKKIPEPLPENGR